MEASTDVLIRYAFVAAATAADATAIIGHLEGYILDRGHTLSAQLVPQSPPSFNG
jgi:hypothetical protein